jgi:hypothetical protein
MNVKFLNLSKLFRAKTDIDDLRGYPAKPVWVYRNGNCMTPIEHDENLDNQSIDNKLTIHVPDFVLASNDLEELRNKVIESFDHLVLAALSSTNQDDCKRFESQKEAYLKARNSEELNKFVERIEQ